MMGSGVDGSTFPHGTQALEFEALVKRAGLTPARAIQSGTTINASGQQIVSSGGTASGTTIQNGGFEYVSSGGTAILARTSFVSNRSNCIAHCAGWNARVFAMSMCSNHWRNSKPL